MPRKILVLTAIPAILSAGAAWLVWESHQVEESQPLKNIKEPQIAKIEIRHEGESIVLEKKAGLWRLLEPLSDIADASACRDLISALAELNLGSEVSRSPVYYAAYELSESSATHLRLFTHQSVAPAFDGYFGKPALGSESLYMRLSREKPVYLASGISQYMLRRGANEYRERSLSPINMGLAQSIKITTPDKTLELEKSSSGWVLSGLSSEKTRSLVSSLFTLRIADFSLEKKSEREMGFTQPILSVIIYSKDKRSLWQVGKTKPQAKGQKPLYRYAKIEGRDAVPLISIYDIDNLLKLLN